MNLPAQTPTPPYYAVIFTSVRSDGDNGYAATAQQILELAAAQPGFLGFESAHQAAQPLQHDLCCCTGGHLTLP